MFRRDKYWIAPFFLVFIAHGLLYYAFPEQHYTSSEGGGGWISYLKYVCLIVTLPALVHARISSSTLSWVSFIVIPIGVSLCLQLYWVNENNLLLFQYTIAMFGYFFGPFALRFFESRVFVERFCLVAIFVIFASTTSELFFGGISQDFSRSGLRGAGPFINPNNTGIIVAILAAVYHYYSRTKVMNAVIALLAALTLVITGSKTGMAIYAAMAFVLLPSRWRFTVLLVVPLLLLMSMDEIADLWSVYELRDFSLESGEIRSVNIFALLEKLTDLSPMEALFGFSNTSLIDNAYLDMMSYGGVSLVMSFVVVQLISIFHCIRLRMKLAGLLHGAFFLAMLTTDLPRLWPTGYMYWCLISVTIFKARLHEKSYASAARDFN